MEGSELLIKKLKNIIYSIVNDKILSEEEKNIIEIIIEEKNYISNQ